MGLWSVIDCREMASDSCSLLGVSIGHHLITTQCLLNISYIVSNYSSTPTVAQVGDLRIFSPADDHLGQRQEIESFIQHPSYRFGQVHNDIGLVRLKNDIKISLDTVPACIWKDEELPVNTYELVGFGSRVSNFFFIDLPMPTVDEEVFPEVFPFVTSECNEICQVNRTKTLESRLDQKDRKLQVFLL